MKDTHYVDGELYLSLATVAEIYSIETLWLEELYERGLLGRGVAAGSTPCIPAARMDRVARIVHLRIRLGLDIEKIAALLERA